MQDIANLLLNTGVSIEVIAYFMYRDFNSMGTLQITLQTLVDTVSALKESVQIFEKKEN